MVKRSIYFLIVAFLSLSACGSVDNPAERVVIVVGDRNITEDELKSEIRRITFEMGITDQGLKHVIEPLINKIIDNYLIFEYGKAYGVVVLDNELNSAIKEIKKGYPEKIFQDMLLHRYIDFDEWKEGLRQQLLIKKIIKKASANIAPVTFNEIKAYFDSHQDEYRCSQMVKLRQIVTQSRDEAEKILGLLTEEQDMDVLARRYSITPEAENGGEVGWIAKSELEKSMEKAVFSLPMGKISPVVKTPYGYHIFEVLDKRPEGFKSLPEVMAEIESKLFLQKKDLFYSRWLKELRDLFPVMVNQGLYHSLEFG